MKLTEVCPLCYGVPPCSACGDKGFLELSKTDWRRVLIEVLNSVESEEEILKSMRREPIYTPADYVDVHNV